MPQRQEAETHKVLIALVPCSMQLPWGVLGWGAGGEREGERTSESELAECRHVE